jgi:hypothetical protein
LSTDLKASLGKYFLKKIKVYVSSDPKQVNASSSFPVEAWSIEQSSEPDNSSLTGKSEYIIFVAFNLCLK